MKYLAGTRMLSVVLSVFAYASVAASLSGFALLIREANAKAALFVGVCGILSGLVGSRSPARTSALVGVCLGVGTALLVLWHYFFFMVID